MNVENNSVSVTRTGIVDINCGYETRLTVNSEDLISLIEKAVNNATLSPVVDYDLKFAGRVTITVEFLGDMKPDKE